MTTDTIDATLAMLRHSLPVAPASVTIGALSAPHMPSVDPIPSSSDGQEPTLLQTPNLRDRLDLAITKARATQSPIDRREWTEEAQSLCERLVDTEAVCPCGVAYSLTTGRCEACDERHEQLTADRARFGVMALDIDENIGF